MAKFAHRNSETQKEVDNSGALMADMLLKLSLTSGWFLWRELKNSDLLEAPACVIRIMTHTGFVFHARGKWDGMK
jgi:hypothetical protein